MLLIFYLNGKALPEKYFVRRPEGDLGKPLSEDFPSRPFFGLEKNLIEWLFLWSKLFFRSGISVTAVSFSYFSSSSLLCFAVHFLLIFLV